MCVPLPFMQYVEKEFLELLYTKIRFWKRRRRDICDLWEVVLVSTSRNLSSKQPFDLLLLGNRIGLHYSLLRPNFFLFYVETFFCRTPKDSKPPTRQRKNPVSRYHLEFGNVLKAVQKGNHVRVGSREGEEASTFSALQSCYVPMSFSLCSWSKALFWSPRATMPILDGYRGAMRSRDEPHSSTLNPDLQLHIKRLLGTIHHLHHPRRGLGRDHERGFAPEKSRQTTDWPRRCRNRDKIVVRKPRYHGLRNQRGNLVFVLCKHVEFWWGLKTLDRFSSNILGKARNIFIFSCYLDISSVLSTGEEIQGKSIAFLWSSGSLSSVRLRELCYLFCGEKEVFRSKGILQKP